VRLDTNLGSDSSTVVVGTSSGDSVFGTNDNWIVTDDSDGTGDPTILHVTANSSSVNRPTAVSYTTGLLGYQYSVTVPPGQTRIVMHFSAQSSNRATALSKAADLAGLGQEALFQITAEDLANIVNFGGIVIPTSPLRFLAPSLSNGNLELFVSTLNGEAISAARTTHILCFSSTNAALPYSAWSPVTNSITLINGLLRVNGLNSADGNRFFRAVETP
jgi:hypothetical protein